MISQALYENAPEASKALWDEQVSTHGRMTNMKRTMAHSPVVLRSYMEWYPLKDEIAKVVGERAAIIFAHAISSETDCLICSTFFRRILAQWGEDPDNLVLNDEEQTLVWLGREIVTNARSASQVSILHFKEKYGETFAVNLIGFAGIMVATNLFNNVLQVELDDYLGEFRK